MTLSGSSTVDTVCLGDWPTDDLEGAAVVLIVFAVLQLVLGAGIMRRERWAWTVGLVVSALVVVSHIFFYRLLDGWAVGGLLTNIAILAILALKQEEFR